MPTLEFETVPIEGTAAEKAVNRVLQRVVNDRNFSWYMFGTETMRLCLIAEGERLGISDNELEGQISQQCEVANERLRRHRAEKADVQRLEEVVDALEEYFDELESEVELPDDIRSKFRQILNRR